MFLALIKNEFIKLFTKKKTYIIILLFVILLGIIVAVGEATERNYIKHNDPAYRIENNQRQIEYEKQYIESIKTDSNMSKEDIENQMTYSEEYIKNLEEEIKSLQQLENNSKEDWKEAAKIQLEEMKKSLSTIENEDQKAYQTKEIEKLETHIKYDIPLDEEKFNKGSNYLYMSIMFISTLFLAFGLVLFNSDNISGEYNPGTMKFLLIQPVTRIKVLLSKYIVMVISSLGLIAGIQLIFYVGVGLINGFGSFYRPMLVGIEYEKVLENGIEIVRQVSNSGYYISLGEYILRMLILQGLFIVTMTAFIYMISTISKSSVISMTVGIGFLLGSNILYSLSTTYRRFSSFIFIHFSDFGNIVTGRIIGDTKALNFTFSMVVIISLVTTAVFITVSSIFFKKRDILI
jgi:ABC-2 type transport system permease protein